jgi:hypothetical protein
MAALGKTIARWLRPAVANVPKPSAPPDAVEEEHQRIVHRVLDV